MQADAYFAMGHSHLVCQDYALVKDGFVAVSDGCSSSPNTDVGARLLVHSMLGRRVPHDIDHACDVAGISQHSLNLPNGALDATLLTLRETGDAITAVIAGDGVAFARRRDTKAIVACTVEFPSGAPFYPNYRNDNARTDRYAVEFGTDKVITWAGMSGLPEDETVDTLVEPFIFACFRKDHYDLVGVGTDGLLAFTQPGERGQRVPVPLVDVLAQLCAIPVPNGQFVARRMRKFLGSYCAERGWRPEDDVGVGMIALNAQDSP